MQSLYFAYRFFKENVGYSIPPGRSVCALRLARAEAWRINEQIDFVWESDPDTTEDDFEFESDKQHVREHGAVGCILYRPCPDHGLNCKHAEILTSLWGITESLNNRERDNYRRVIEAELALDVMPSNRKESAA